MTNTLDLRTLFVIAFKFKRRAGVTFLVFFLLAAAASILVPVKYQSTSNVLVKIGRELIYRADVGSAGSPIENVDKDQLIASNIAIMQSGAIEQDAIRAITIERLYPDIAGLEPGPEFMQAIKSVLFDVKEWLGIPEESMMRKAVRRFDKNLSIDLIKKTGIIEVSFMHPDPAIAAEGANLIVSLFQQRVGSIYDNPNLSFEEKRVEVMRTALDSAEAKLNAYRRSHTVYALDNQVDLLLQQKGGLDSKLKDTDAQIVTLQGLTAAIAGQVAVTPKSISIYTETERHRAVDDAASQLLQLRLQERQMATRFGSDYPPLVEVRNQIKLAQSEVSSQTGEAGSHTRTGINDVRTALDQSLMQNQAQLQSLFGTRTTLSTQIAELETSISELVKKQPELAQLQRDVDLRTAAVKTSYDKLVETQTVDGLNHETPASFSVYQPAVPSDPADPARPLPLLYMLIGTLVGILGALVALFMSYRMFNGFLTPRQASVRLDRPVLAVVDYNRRLGSWRRPGALEHSDDMSMPGMRGKSQAVAV